MQAHVQNTLAPVHRVFTASILNRNTRAAYARAAKQFCDWCEERRLEFHKIEAIAVAAYVEQLGQLVAKPSVNIRPTSASSSTI